MLSDWWRDLIDIIVSVSTVVAAVLAVGALVATKKQAKQIQRERHLAHERDILKELLDLALSPEAAKPGMVWKPGMAFIRTLAPETRERIPMSLRYFNNRWKVDLAPEVWERHGDPKNLNWSIGPLTWDHPRADEQGNEVAPHRSVLAVIYDELIEAINQTVNDAASP